ncbi:benzoylformate decarboxylase [Parasphingopyxis marina]|uniref:Benzoylformate decarboxylase n=1 Tax=Parasphingopyxis marina TaxID=2761622 RepID=A0A842I182_9SPHN|nr:benzoylformate decarboxylase [Parasphingopyxis marina]MBC2778491.1 benzoylformate decarboxylase [Parasphingopyxis marina]
MINVRTAFYDLLRQHGIDRIFGNPGSTELTMFTDFPEDFSYVGALQESVALGIADSYAQTSGRPAVVNLHSSVGMGHAMGALFTAYRNRTPLIVTAGQQSRPLLLHDPFLMANRPTELPQPFVKWAVEPARAADVPQALARALSVATSYPQGPVFLSIPAEDWDEEAEAVAYRPPSPAPGPDPEQAVRVAEAMASAKAPALVVGGEVDRDKGWEEVVAVAEALGAPVYIPPMEGRVGFPQSHELFAGMLPPEPENIVRTLSPHDAILVFGARVFTMHVDGPRPYVPTEARIFQVSTDTDLLSAAPAGEAVQSSTRLAAAAIRDALGRPGTNYASRELPTAIAGDAIGYPFLFETLQRLRDPEAPIVEEAPTARRDLPDFLPVDRPDTFFTCSSGGLGFGMPAAVGAALARPDKRTVAIIGDGSAMYAVQALWTAAKQQANVAFLILNNGRYAALDGFGRRFGIAEPPGCDLSGLDFVALAAGQNVPGSRVEKPEALEAAIKAVLEAQGPALLDIAIG